MTRTVLLVVLALAAGFGGGWIAKDATTHPAKTVTTKIVGTRHCNPAFGAC